MAEETKKYPNMPLKHWWTLREQFRRSIPGSANSTYLASVLNMQENSAETNILPTLRLTGLVDENDKPTDRAVKWRDDSSYKEVCKSIIKEVYPEELTDAAPDPSSDRETAKRWFATTTGLGQVAVNRMLAFYMLLLDADPNKKTSAGSSKPISKPTAKQPEKKVSPKKEPTELATTHETYQGKSLPSLNFNFEIHISPESTAEHIDKIFESMARHLKKFLTR